MKTIISLLHCLLLFGLLNGPFSETVYSAQETRSSGSPTSELATMIAPLIDDQVVLIVHIDLQKFDFDLIFEKTILFIESGLKTANLPPGQTMDARTLTMIRSNIQAEFDYMFRDFKEIRKRLTQEAGIKDIFLLIYQDMAPYVPVIMVSPLKDKTPAQRRVFAQVVRGTFPILFSEREFMVCSVPHLMNQKDEADPILRAKLKDLKNSETAYLHKAFAQQDGSAATIIGVIPPKTSEYIASLPSSPMLSDNFQRLGIFATERIKWISTGLNINNTSVKVIGQTTNNTEASQIVTAIERVSANSLNDMIKQAETDPNAAGMTPEQKQKAIENIRNLQAEFLPVVSNDNQLLLLMDQETKPQALGLVLRPLVLGYRSSQQATWGNQCATNLKTLAEALGKYAAEKGTYPPVWTVDTEGKPFHSWRVLILPYLDEEELYNSIKLDESWDSPHNRQFHAKMPTVFRCPASRFANETTTTYSWIVGPNTCPPGPRTLKPSDVTDNPNSTIMLVERKNSICWMRPEEITEENALKGINIERGIGSDHQRGGANTAFFDATIRFIANNAPPNALKTLLSYNSGEEVPLP